MAPESKPAFIAFVGVDEETNALCSRVEHELRNSEVGTVCALGDPFRAWDANEVLIGNRPKSTYCAASRFHFRWGMFITFLREVVCAAFHAGAQVFLVRRFGFDLVNGSEVFAREEGILEEHDFLVQRYIKDWGLIPPLYVVTERITPWLRAQLDKYFKDGSGQRYIEIPYHWDREKKVRAIVSIVRDELEGRPPELLAA